MPTFPDLYEFFDPDLHLPVGGKDYRIKAPNVNENLRIRRFFTDPESVLGDEQHVVELLKILGGELAESGDVVGGVAEEMVADGIGWDELVHIGSTALVHFAIGEEAAIDYWEKGTQAIPPEPKKAPAKKAPAKRAPRKVPAKKAAPAKRTAK